MVFPSVLLLSSLLLYVVDVRLNAGLQNLFLIRDLFISLFFDDDNQ